MFVLCVLFFPCVLCEVHTFLCSQTVSHHRVVCEHQQIIQHIHTYGMISSDISGLGLSDTSSSSRDLAPRRLEFSSDSFESPTDASAPPAPATGQARGVCGTTPLASGPGAGARNGSGVPPAAPQRDNSRPRREQEARTVHVMNSVCTPAEARAAEEGFRELAAIARDFQTWMLPPKSQRDPFA